MALDGLVIAGMVQELNTCILGGRISKIAQPESDELMLTIKSERRQQYRLLISAGASLPLIYFTDQNKPAPLSSTELLVCFCVSISGEESLPGSGSLDWSVLLILR